MPDYLPKPSTFVGEISPHDEEEERAHKEWLSSSIRCFLDSEAVQDTKAPSKLYRVTTYWWLVMMDDAFRGRTTQGWEAFSSPQTLQAVKQLLGAQASLQYLADAATLLKSSRFPWQWCAVPLDQCSVGMCGVGFLKKVLRLYIEPVFDPAHRFNNDLLGGLRQAHKFHLILVMKLMYNFNYSCFGTGKWKSELIDFMRSMKASAPKELELLWSGLLPDIAHDLGMPEMKHDAAWSASTLDTVIEDVLENKGPKMAISGWGDWVSCCKY